jgi:hypothetical protein
MTPETNALNVIHSLLLYLGLRLLPPLIYLPSTGCHLTRAP